MNSGRMAAYRLDLTPGVLSSTHGPLHDRILLDSRERRRDLFHSQRTSACPSRLQVSDARDFDGAILRRWHSKPNCLSATRLVIWIDPQKKVMDWVQK